MSELIQSADAIRNLARLYKHMEKAAIALESIGSLDQAKGEKEKILADLDEAIAVQRAEVLKQAGLVGDAHKNAADIEAKAHDAADKTLADANMRAAQIKADAVAQMVADDAAHERVLSAAENAAKKKVSESEAEVGRLTQDAASYQKIIEEQRAELQQLTDAITAARATMAQIMGK